MRQIDETGADLKKLQVHAQYLESARHDLETKLVEKQRELDQSQREKKIMEAQVADVRAENEVLYASEDRVKRLMEDIESMKAQMRVKDREMQMMGERNSAMMDENLALQREFKMKAQDQIDRGYQQKSEERVIQKQLQKIKELETSVMEGVIRGKELEGQIKALEVRVEQANKEST